MIIEIPQVKTLEELRLRLNEVLRELGRQTSTSRAVEVSGLEAVRRINMTALQNKKDHLKLKDLATRYKDLIQNEAGDVKIQTTVSGIEGTVQDAKIFTILRQTASFSGEVECLNGLQSTSSIVESLKVLSSLEAKDYFAGDGSQGITANREFVDYSGYTHNVEIKDGLITLWTVT